MLQSHVGIDVTADFVGLAKVRMKARQARDIGYEAGILSPRHGRNRDPNAFRWHRGFPSKMSSFFLPLRLGSWGI
jgi:hypothetical protein